MACLTPYIVKMKLKNCTIPVPCGKCPECLKRRVSGWSFRLMQEDKYCDSAYFLTLTYDTATVHITENGFMGLHYRDVQLFIKKLRKAHDVEKDNLEKRRTIKYYAVGEYGGRTLRPHYHLIIFNTQLDLMYSSEDIKLLELSEFDGQVNVKCFQWEHGHVTVGQVNGASVGYTLKYMCKPSRIPMHRNDDRERERSLISKGLGEEYLTNVMVRWHHMDMKDRMYLTLEDGKKIAMPRYYKDKIYTESERKYINWHCERLRQKKLRKQEKKGNIPSERDKAEGVKAAFKKMYQNAMESRDKV